MIRIAFFDTRSYDRETFGKYISDDIEISFFEGKLNIKTIEVVRNHDAVCVFVNDEVNEEVINKLYEYGVRIVALRCAGYNNVDLKAAFKKVHVVHVPAYSPYAVAEHAMALLLTSIFLFTLASFLTSPETITLRLFSTDELMSFVTVPPVNSNFPLLIISSASKLSASVTMLFSRVSFSTWSC